MKSFLNRLLRCLFLLSALAAVLFISLPLPGTIPVLMYHFVGSQEDAAREGNVVSRESLAMQMAFLKKLGYRVLTLDDYYAVKTGRQKPKGREVLITFDDGDASFEQEAVSILKRYELPVTMFLISDSVRSDDGHFMPLTTIQKLQAAYPWMAFESHSKTHPHLKEIPDAQVEEEIIGSKKDLEEMLGKPVRYLAYPFGQFDARSREAAQKAGYRIAFTTSHKKLKELVEEDLYAMTRIKINNRSSHPLVFWYHISGIHQTLKGARHKIKNIIGF